MYITHIHISANAKCMKFLLRALTLTLVNLVKTNNAIHSDNW